jgi:glycosyltransferase involved in cell wall biosynthesis
MDSIELKKSPPLSAAVPHILFVVGQLTVGGIETYVVRMARAYAKAGGTVSVWIIKHSYDVELLAMLQAVADVTFIASRFTRYPIFAKLPKIPHDVNLVFTTGRLSLLYAAQACAIHQRRVRLVAGVFSQWEYVIDDGNPLFRLSGQIIDQIGPDNMVFCTIGSRRDHAAVLGKRYNESYITPLLVDLPKVSPEVIHRRDGRPFQIVTVSRLVKFKTSNIQMPAIIRKLANAGHDVRWTLYGDGPDRTSVVQAITEAKIGHRVTLANPIPYSELTNVISKADLYIGAGTTMIEASALGVPSLVALDDNQHPTTPGYFADIEEGYTSDWNGLKQPKLIFEEILRALNRDHNERACLRDRSIKKAQRLSAAQSPVEINTVIARSRQVEPTKIDWFALKIISGFIVSAMSQALIRLRRGQTSRYS